jgi:hypothetical protein
MLALLKEKAVVCADVSLIMRFRFPRAPFQPHLRNSKIHASDPSCWSPTVIIALGCERGVPFLAGLERKRSRKAESGNANLLKLSYQLTHWPEQRNAQPRTIVKSNTSSGDELASWGVN